MGMGAILILFVFLMGYGSFPSFAWPGEIYRWTDDRGTVHLTDDRSKIPKEYVDRAQTSSFPEGSTTELPARRETDRSGGRVQAYLEDLERKIEEKRALERQMEKLQEELKASEDRLKWIEEDEKENFQYYQPFRDPRTGRWVPVASPYYVDKVKLLRKIDDLKAELVSLEERLSLIRRSL